MTNTEFLVGAVMWSLVLAPFIFVVFYSAWLTFEDSTLFKYLFKKKNYEFYKRYELDEFSGFFCKGDKFIYKYEIPVSAWRKYYKHEYKSIYPHLSKNEVRRCYDDVFEKIPYKEIKYKDFKNARELKRSFSIAVKK